MVEEQQPVKVTRQNVNTDTENIDDSLKENEFAHELANASLPSYLKDLYVKFSFPGGSANTLKDEKMNAANTIRSFENQATGKLTVFKAQAYYKCMKSRSYYIYLEYYLI